MTANLGMVDRAVRAIAGIVLLALLFVIEGGLGWLLALIGVVLLGTAFMSFCPLYRALGLSTRERAG
jgi:hypothetical protein